MTKVHISDSGTLRSTTGGKVNYSLMRDGPMYDRWAIHLTKGGASTLDENRLYPARNWMLSCTLEDLTRYKEGAARHFEQWYAGKEDEDHASALFFNINGAEYVKDYLRR